MIKSCDYTQHPREINDLRPVHTSPNPSKLRNESFLNKPSGNLSQPISFLDNLLVLMKEQDLDDLKILSKAATTAPSNWVQEAGCTAPEYGRRLKSSEGERRRLKMMQKAAVLSANSNSYFNTNFHTNESTTTARPVTS